MPAPETTKVEHVARAICRAEGIDPDELFEDAPLWCHYEDEAKAAIGAVDEWEAINNG